LEDVVVSSVYGPPDFGSAAFFCPDHGKARLFSQESGAGVDTDDISDRMRIEAAMFHVLRDASGQISSLHRDPVAGSHMLPADHPEVIAFIGSESEQLQFAHMDASLVRVVEDLIDALIRRNVLCITDLPMEAQLKLFDRKHFREGTQSHALNLFGSAQTRESLPGVGAQWPGHPD
jgi:hypothetical protein